MRGEKKMSEVSKIYIKIFTESVVEVAFLTYTLYRVYCGCKKRDVEKIVYWVFLALVAFASLLSNLLL